MPFIVSAIPESFRGAILSTLACIMIVGALLPTGAVAQTIVLQDVDPSGFPTIRARFRALDRDMNPIVGLGPSDFTVTENGVSRPVLDVTECTETRLVPLTVGIMVDTKYHIELARAGTKRLAGFLRMPPSEIGITTMDAGVYVVQDLTRNREKVIAKADALEPAPGVDLQRMFYDPQAGGVSFVAGRPNRKVLILITDLHCPMLNLDTARLFADAARENIAVYSVLLHSGDYTGLFRTMAQRTGGELFENVTAEEQINDIFLRIGLEQYGVPCLITWESAPLCRTDRSAIVSLPAHGATGTGAYNVSLSSIPHLDLSPSGLAFGRVDPGTTREKQMTITARVGEVTVRNLNSSDSRYTVVDYGGSPPPFTLAKDESRTLWIRYAPGDSSYIFAMMTIGTDLCPASLYLTGGFPGLKGGASQTLRLTHPNGGEEFIVGTDTVITWEGVLPDDPVRLEYSIDAGATWNTIAARATGLRHAWRAPHTPSRRCLTRATQLMSDHDSVLRITSGALRMRWNPNGNELAFIPRRDTTIQIFDAIVGNLVGHSGGDSENFYTHDWSPDGGRLAVGGDIKTAFIWNRATGETLFSLNHNDPDLTSSSHWVADLSWSPDGTFLATISTDAHARIWNAATGARVKRIDLLESGRLVEWNRAGDRLAFLTEKSIVIWDVPADTLVTTIPGNFSGIRLHLAWSPTEDRIAAIAGRSGDSACVWDATTGALVARGPAHASYGPGFSGWIEDIAWSPNGRSIASASVYGEVIVWNASTGAETYRRVLEPDAITHNISRRHRIDWSPDGTYLASAWWSRDVGPSVYLLDAATGTVLKTLMYPGPIFEIAWSPDGTRLATTYEGGLKSAFALVWSPFGYDLQQDVSDALWSIIAPEPDLRVIDIDMGRVRVGRGKDSLVTAVLCNRGGVPLHVLGMDVTGGDVADFMIPSGAGDFTLAPGECRDVTFEFMPTELGNRSATITVRMAGDTLADTIRVRGVGVAPMLRLESADIDFGAIRVGATKDTTVAVVLRNVGGAPITITNVVQGGPDIPSFTVVSGGGTFTLDPGGTHALQLRFTPRGVGRTTGRIAFEHAESGSPEVARLVGRGLGGIVYLPDDSAAAGERFPLALMIDPQGPRTTGGGEQRFRARIGVDQTTLAPDDAMQPGVIDSGVRIFTVEGVWDEASDTLARIPMLALLGNVEQSPLELLSFDWLDASARPLSIESETRSGRFTLLDLCRDGGLRLYDQHGIEAALKVAPNPVADAFELEYDLAEDGRIAIDLYDLAGVKVRSILDADRPAGSYRMKLSTRQLPAGAYLLTLRTPTQLLSRKVEVRK